VEAAGADVFHLAVYFGGQAGDFLDGVFGELYGYSFGGEERDVLFYQGVAGFCEDALEVVLCEAFQFHADGQTALQLGDEVRGLGEVEGAGGDEEDVVGFDAGGRVSKPMAVPRRLVCKAAANAPVR